ncbi:MAG: UDP-N-acetylmuramoyl-L-alanine--D-glutamate ligase [Wenzhouxiangella sp.]|nr:MAG: UDP-N-acetylmuramoyl-L-alanine--D-glutamate ligase [Wenzhouxiangella sp.]
MKLAELARARVGILGFGREGKAAFEAIRRFRSAADLTVLVESGTVPEGIPVQAGPFDDRLEDFEVLIRSPGVPVLHPALERFHRAGGRVVNPGSIWFAERPDLPVVAVTGSKGKSTTSSMLAGMLSAGGRRVVLAGNIGVPLLAHLDCDADLVVVELSSYQLADLEGRLAFGIMTRLFPEHGDWHGGWQHYYASKMRMVDLLFGAPLLINAGDETLREHTRTAPGRLLGNRSPLVHRSGDGLYSQDRRLTSLERLRLIGRHNLDNAALAVEAALRLGVGLETAVGALEAFEPLAHRLEVVARRDGVDWINDSIATTPHATLAALQALDGQRVVLIAGGYVRPADWRPVLEFCRDRPLHGLVLMPDSGPVIARAFAEAGLEPVAGMNAVDNLSSAVREAASMTGEAPVTVLLSPGAASFPKFRDFEDRGQQFHAAVADYYSDRSTA